MQMLIQISSNSFYHYFESNSLQLSIIIFSDNRLFPDKNNINTESTPVISINLSK